ncbi:MAG TPA: hypothetical protein VFZ25_09565 [Chloroflexota bacterium]|nr:hypothetical protein [Chloroflexota bacterium]
MTDRPPPHEGIRLGEQGWDQGSLLRIPRAEMSFLQIEDALGGWVRAENALGPDDLLVVTSQVCDIVKNPRLEPFVEVARAFWSTDKAVIRNAKLNSVRNFCLQRRAMEDGLEEGLIVDATFRIFVRKESLLSLIPTPGFAAEDRLSSIRFRRWLGARYNRQPIPDHLVGAVQRPIVDGLRKLRSNDPQWLVLDGIGEVIFFADDSEEPYRIELFFLRDEYGSTPVVNQADVDGVAGWIAGQLKKVGKAVLDRQILTDLHSISAHDYATLYHLPLDSYSLPEEPS